MWKAIKYLFYKSYKFYKYEMGDSTPHIMGVLVVTTLLSFFLLTIFGFTGLFLYLNKQIWLIFVILFLAFWFYILLHKGRWKEIIKEFENENEQQRKRGRILCILFTIFTIVMFIASVFFI